MSVLLRLLALFHLALFVKVFSSSSGRGGACPSGARLQHMAADIRMPVVTAGPGVGALATVADSISVCVVASGGLGAGALARLARGAIEVLSSDICQISSGFGCSSGWGAE